MSDDLERLSAFPFNAQSGNTTAEQLSREYHARRILAQLAETDMEVRSTPPSDWIQQLTQSRHQATTEELREICRNIASDIHRALRLHAQGHEKAAWDIVRRMAETILPSTEQEATQ